MTPRYCAMFKMTRWGARYCSRLRGHGGSHRFGRHWKELAALSGAAQEQGETGG